MCNKMLNRLQVSTCSCPGEQLFENIVEQALQERRIFSHVGTTTIDGYTQGDNVPKQNRNKGKKRQ